ncbi:MAG: DnaJ domain-containing protein, partial [Verrucomicrobia bacterium]|nr:DnaJ domain-containing protein [Verrucomicrobiota bacterium]
MKYHNYYQVLGVDERAGTDEILEAFRYHARECHGMAINGDQSASQRFNELNEAFDVLDDQERRGKYDALGHHWGHLSEFTPPPLLRRGHSDRYGMLTTEHTYSLHVEGTGFSDFFENLFAFRYHTPHEGLSDFI